MTAKTRTPKVCLWSEDDGAVVMRTQDVDAARAAVRSYYLDTAGYSEEELPELLWWLDDEPVAEHGRWTFGGSASVEEGYRIWSPCPAGSRGASPSVVWYP